MRKINKLRILISIMVCSMLVMTGCMVQKDTTIQEQNKQSEAAANVSGETSVKVHFIDVGQGDSILIQSQGKNMLIDAGDNEHGQTVVNYLKKQGIKRIDHLVGTHPDADHIGGLDNVILNFQIGKIYMPKVQNNTKTFEDVLLAVKQKKLKITAPKVKDIITVGAAKATILGPTKTYDDMNNNSIVIRVTHDKKSFLFEGDAEIDEEWDILNSGMRLKSDVIKVGHHGSHTSSSKKYIEAVNPKTAIISCGVDNRYGHPHAETLTKFKAMKIKTYRTDLQGTIIATSDGSNITYKTLKSVSNETIPSNPTIKATPKPAEKTSSATYYIGNKNSKKFHLPTCRSLPLEKNRVKFSSRSKAISSGYDPCGLCNP